MKYRLLYLIVLFHFFLQSQTPFTRVRYNLTTGDYKSSLSLLDSCETKSNSQDSILYYRALVQVKSGDKEQSEKTVKKLMKLYPAFAEAHYIKGLLCFLDESYGKSANEFGKAIKSNPKDIKALYNRSLASGMLEDYLAAIEDLNTCIELDSTYQQAYYSRAYWYEYTGNYPEAAKDYQQSIRLNPKYFDAYFGLAYIYQAQKETTRACEIISKAIAAGSQIAEELKDSFCK